MKILKYTKGSRINCSVKQEKCIFTQEKIHNYIWEMNIRTFNEGEASRIQESGYEKISVVLEGNAIYSINNNSAERLGPLAKIRYSGDNEISSFGVIKELSLSAKNEFPLASEVIHVNDKKNIPIDYIKGFHRGSIIIYCQKGFGVLNILGNKNSLNQEEYVVVDFNEGDFRSIDILGKGSFIISLIYFNDEEESGNNFGIGDEDSKEEVLNHTQDKLDRSFKKCISNSTKKLSPYNNSSTEDFKFALKLAVFSRRGFGMKNSDKEIIVYSKKLKKSLRKLKSSYIEFIIMFAGVISLPLISNAIIGSEHIIFIILSWIFMSLFVISPYIYYRAIPKPICEHVRYIDSLTTEEAKEFVDVDFNNGRTDRILKRYKYSGRHKYFSDDEND